MPEPYYALLPNRRLGTCSHCLRPVRDRYEHLNLTPSGDAWLWTCVAR